MDEPIPAAPRKGSRRRRLQYGVGALLFVVGGWLILRSSQREPPEQHAQRLSKEQGIVVSFGDPSTFFAPPYTHAIPSSREFDARPAERDAAAVALTAIERALESYPPAFVAKQVRAIFICGDMFMDGVPAGGNTGPSWIILAAPKALGVEGIYNTSFLGVHHELSSFVLRKDSSLVTAWQSLSPATWEYTVSASEGLKRGTGPAPDLSTGFLSAYGGTSVENDFNTYAEQIFTVPAALMAKAAQHTLIAKKLRFVLHAYEQTDARMRDVFVRLGYRGFLEEQ